MRLSRIRDFAGREIHDEYDSNGDLISVTGPAIAGTSTGYDFPLGREERYTYSSGFAAAALNHNLLSVTNPEEVAAGGPPAISWEYGTDRDDPVTFDRVIAEHLGGGAANASGIAAGGTLTFEYSMLNENEPPGLLDLARGMVLVTERNGNQFEYYVNELNHHILTRHLTRGLREDEPPYYETRSFYDADGQLVRRIYPEGNEVRYTYATGERGAQANRIEERRIADSDRGGGEDLVTTWTYEPLFNQPTGMTDPRGNATGFEPPIGTASAERYTTRWFYDYQEENAAAIQDLAAGFGLALDDSTAAALALDTDLNADGRTD